MFLDLFKTAIRYFLIGLSTWLVSKGYWDANLTEPMIGLALTLFTIIWYLVSSFIPRWKAHREFKRLMEAESHEQITKDEL